MWFIDEGMSSRQGMDLRRIIWESLVSYRDQCLPCLFLYQCLLRLHDLEFKPVSFVRFQDFPSESTPCFLSESLRNFLDHLTGVIQYSRWCLVAQQLIYIFIWLKKKANFLVPHTCQHLFVGKLLMQPYVSNFSRTEYQKNLYYLKNPLRKCHNYYNLCLKWFSFTLWPLLFSPGR